MRTQLRSPAHAGALALTILCGSLFTPSTTFAQPAQGVEELTSGPVHEAFAASIAYDPEPGIIIDRQPPELIEELPPEQRPVGNNVDWIPGYWGWDEDRTDFIWISGIWRSMPPGRQWVPGYWAATGSRWQWTSGYWSLENEQETTYLPAPPKSVESGPNVDAPSDNHIWVSGNWAYRENRYAWRPGYWEPAQENWVWIPAHYRWTPRGHVFIEGYWDYDVDRRGMVFAPVYFDRVVYSRPDYHYTPLTVIALNVFSSHLFVRPRYSHYYFGDYYAPRYRDNGFFASFSYHRERRGYDPIYAHDRWHHRNDRDWDRRRGDNFDFYRNNESARPPRTLAALLARPENERRGRRDDYDLARPLSRMIEDRDSRQRFVKIDRKDYTEKSREIRNFSRERGKLESRGDGPSRDKDKPNTVIREKMGRSPLAAKQLQGDDAPPVRRERREETTRGPQNEREERPAGMERGKPEERQVPGQRREVPGQKESDEPRKMNPGQDKERESKPDVTNRERKETPAVPSRREPGNNGNNERTRPETTPEVRKVPQNDIPEKRQEMKPAPAPQRQREPEQRQRPAPEVRQVPQKNDIPEKRQEMKPAPAPQRQREPEQRQRPAPEVRKAPETRRAEPQRQPERQESRPQRPAIQERREVKPQQQERKVERPQQAPQQQRQESRPAPQKKSEDGGKGRGKRD